MIQLFQQYPLLRNRLPYVSLGTFPTPIQKLERLGKDTGIGHLYVKRDDLSGKVYGGNKIRKLEFLLGHALQAGVKEVLTFGSAGSNHATATAIYAQQVGLKSISMLIPQPNAHYVRLNILMSHHYKAELHQYRNMRFLCVGKIYQLLRHKLKQGRFPEVISLGGSSPLGTIGYVNAAFELREQVVEGRMPEPDLIYVPLGTMGTVVGLILGLKAANFKSQVISVLVADEKFVKLNRMVTLFKKTNSYLHSLDPSFSILVFSWKDQEIRQDFFGEGYARFTKEGMDALLRMEKTEGIKLEGTYTGKTLAALIHDARKKYLRDKVVLFWNTCNSKDFSDVIANIDYQELPRCFHRYFEEEVQPLDRDSAPSDK